MATKFLDQDGLQYLLTQLAAYIEQKTQINVVSNIDEDSTNQEIAGAKAVYDLVQAALVGITGIKMKVVTTLPTTRENNIVYLIQVDSDTYRQWIFSGGQWFDLGIAEIDLSNYWSKEDLTALTNAEIQTIFDDAMGT